jgi:hypothetical protein
VNQSPTFHTDLVAALGALTEVPKTGKVNAGQRKYTYMTLPDLLAHVRETFTAYHMGVTQMLFTTDTGHMGVETVIRHVSGESLSSGVLMFDGSPNPQVVGSAVTYMKRYQLSALVGLAGDDDDDGGRAAQRAQEPRRAPEPRGDDYGTTRPVQRATQAATDPDPFAAPAADPITPAEMGDGVGRTHPASDKSIRMMWSLIRRTMSDEQARVWVGTVLNLPNPDWHTSDLTQAQVSAVIDRLKGATDA